jgi:hypothetical protein
MLKQVKFRLKNSPAQHLKDTYDMNFVATMQIGPSVVVFIIVASVTLYLGILTFSLDDCSLLVVVKGFHVRTEQVCEACSQGVPLDCPWSPEAGENSISELTLLE